MKLTLLLFITAFSISNSSYSQNKYEDDVLLMLDLNSSKQTYDIIFDQMVHQLKVSVPEVPDTAWISVKTQIFDEEVKSLSQKLIPLYKEHFTHDEIKSINSFYQTPVWSNNGG